MVLYSRTPTGVCKLEGVSSSFPVFISGTTVEVSSSMSAPAPPSKVRLPGRTQAVLLTPSSSRLLPRNHQSSAGQQSAKGQTLERAKAHIEKRKNCVAAEREGACCGLLLQGCLLWAVATGCLLWAASMGWLAVARLPLSLFCLQDYQYGAP